MKNKEMKDTGSGFHVHVYSSGNNIAESITQTYTINGNVYFGSRQAEKPKATKEQIAHALAALNGRGNVIDSQRAWLGACLLLGWKYGFSRNLSDCCKQIDQLPLDMGKLEFQCKYESIRMYASWKFVKENYANWPTLVPREDERPLFEKCLSVAMALDQEIENQMMKDAENN
jgi:hypothetical protein